MGKKKISGFTDKTVDNMLLDAGAYFKSFEVGVDTYESAVEAGKLLGATRGGGAFSAIPAIRQVEVDGVVGTAKGLEVIDGWDVTITANVIEVTKGILSAALAGGAIDSVTSEEYDIITSKNVIEESDYIDNITWVGRLSGSNAPVIIQVYNALNTSGLTLTTQSKNEAVTVMTFKGHYDTDDLDTPPFKIYHPKPSGA